MYILFYFQRVRRCESVSEVSQTRRLRERRRGDAGCEARRLESGQATVARTSQYYQHKLISPK